jgi:hypothetical protein
MLHTSTLRVFKSKLLWRIVKTTIKELTGGWRILHIEEHNNFYTLNIIIMI